jgi:hypothetical protein
MSFKMRCPKCKGLDYSIERDNRTFGAVAQAFELVFHCRCGKQMFGEQILKEYEVQKKEWEEGSDGDDTSAERPAHTLLRETAEGREQAAAAEAKPMLTPKADPPAAKGTPTPAPAKVAKPKATAKDPKKAAKAPEPVVGAEMCSWPGCGKPARKNSKYCSRACSNKNARHRHKLRGKTDE